MFRVYFIGTNFQPQYFTTSPYDVSFINKNMEDWGYSQP